MPRLDGNPNPQDLSYEEIHAMVKACPLCGTPWPEGLFTCADPDCKTKLRVTPDAFNWWHFYSAINTCKELPMNILLRIIGDYTNHLNKKEHG